MTTQPLIKYVEGGNRITLAAIAIGVLTCLFFYDRAAAYVAVSGIDVQILYSYVLNLFAIELGALISMFTLLACRPTPYLERIKNTAAFKSLMSNLKITLVLSSLCIVYTFLLGITKHMPTSALDLNSDIFLGWLFLCVAVTGFYVRSIRLTFLALM